MAKVSRKSLPQDLEKRLIGNLFSALNKLSETERVVFLDKLLTPTEKTMLAKRMAILSELGKGTTYEKVEEKYNVISATVSRMSTLLKTTPKLLEVLSKIDDSVGRKTKGKPTPKRVYGSRTIAGTKRIFGI